MCGPVWVDLCGRACVGGPVDISFLSHFHSCTAGTSEQVSRLNGCVFTTPNTNKIVLVQFASMEVR